MKLDPSLLIYVCPGIVFLAVFLKRYLRLRVSGSGFWTATFEASKPARIFGAASVLIVYSLMKLSSVELGRMNIWMVLAYAMVVWAVGTAVKGFGDILSKVLKSPRSPELPEIVNPYVLRSSRPEGSPRSSTSTHP